MSENWSHTDPHEADESLDSSRIDGLIAKYGNDWLGNARRRAKTPEDADDVYQRAMEVLFTKAPNLPDEELAAWIHTVIRNEVTNSFRRRRHETDFDFAQIVESLESQQAIPEERLLETEELIQGRQALRHLRTDHARCLLLRADGLDYETICAVTGFSYAKVNRYLSEGRKTLRTHINSVESGIACERYLPTLSMIADNEASPAARAETEAHLRDCLHCQATLREFITTPQRVRSVFPLAPALLGGLLQSAQSSLESLHAWVSEKISGLSSAIQFGTEASTARRIGGGVAASLALLAGGATIHQVTTGPPEQKRPPATEARSDSGTEASTDRSETAARPVKRRSSRSVRDARESDVVGKRAGRSAGSAPSTAAADEASAPSDDSFDPAPDDNSSVSAPGSSRTYSDLAP